EHVDPELSGLLLRARELAGEEGVQAELQHLAPKSAEARLRVAELAEGASVTTAWDAAVEARGEDPRPLAARARSRASGHDEPGARKDLEAFAVVLAEALADVGAAPVLARALRDAAWARSCLNDKSEAAALAVIAARGWPEDLDAALVCADLRAAHP